MKKGWKRFWIICAVCAGIGLVCCMMSLVLGVTVDAIRARFPGGIHITDNVGIYLWGEDSEYAAEGSFSGDIKREDYRAVYSRDEIRSIDVDSWGTDVEFVETEEDSAEIVVEGVDIPRKLKFKQHVEEGELKIETDEKIRNLNMGDWGTIYVYIPEGYTFSEASIDIGAGYIYIEDIHAEELSVEIGAGETEIADFTAKDAEFQCGAGTISASGTITGDVDIECGMGEVDFMVGGSMTDFNCDIECGMGNIIWGDEEFSGIGGTKTINNHAPNNMDIKCGMGNVKVSFEE